MVWIEGRSGFEKYVRVLRNMFGFGGKCSGGGRSVRERGRVFGFEEEGVGDDAEIPLFWSGLRVMLDKNRNVCYNGKVRG